MLVLSRKKGESFVIETGEDVIEIRVVETASNRTRIGIAAPPWIRVRRAEMKNAGRAYGPQRKLEK